MTLSEHRDEFLVLFADCVPVLGRRRLAIYDLGRHEIHLFPSEFHGPLLWVTNRPVGEVLDELGDPGASELPGVGALYDFVQYLLNNELLMLVSDPTAFPPLSTEWDLPGEIENAIVDVDEVLHDFAAIVGQLDLLGCQFLQVRGFSPLLTLDVCREILVCASNTSIAGLEVILCYDKGVPQDAYVDFVRSEPLLTSLTVHSAPESLRAPVHLPLASPETEPRAVVFTRQVIDSESHCGVILPTYLNAPTVRGFAEAQAFNGCLNRKISIDSRGAIRNCPSMGKAFGFASQTPLAEAVHDVAFTSAWHIAKDMIDVCRECEFRYICSDCRAYLRDPSNPVSKPLKCGYDPDTTLWSSGAIPPFPQQLRDNFLRRHAAADESLPS